MPANDIAPGAVVGWRGMRCEIAIDYDDGTVLIEWRGKFGNSVQRVPVSELTDPPPVPGEYVGHAGHRCQVVRVYPWSEKCDLRTTIAGKTVGILGVPYSELSAAPPPAAHVEAAGQALAGFLTNPRQIFEEGK